MTLKCYLIPVLRHIIIYSYGKIKMKSLRNLKSSVDHIFVMVILLENVFLTSYSFKYAILFICMFACLLLWGAISGGTQGLPLALYSGITPVRFRGLNQGWLYEG